MHNAKFDLRYTIITSSVVSRHCRLRVMRFEGLIYLDHGRKRSCGFVCIFTVVFLYY